MTENNMESLWGLSVGKGSRMLKALGKFKGLRKLGLTCHSADVWEMTENILILTMLESLRLRLRDLLGQPANLELGLHMKGLWSLSKLYMLGRLDGSGAGLGCLPGNLRVLTLSMSELQYSWEIATSGQTKPPREVIRWPNHHLPSKQFPESLRAPAVEARATKGDQNGSRINAKSLEELEIRGCKQTRKINGLKNATKLKHVKFDQVDETIRTRS